MLETKKYSIQGEETGVVKLVESIFAVQSKNPDAVIYEVINMYLANQRQGTKAVQTRSDAHGSGKKLFRQKGTGNARPGNLRTPLRVGGGNAFGPKPKNWYRKIPKKKKRLALKLALTQKAGENKIKIIESLSFEKPDLKKALDILTKITDEQKKILLIIDGNDRNIVKSFDNIPFCITDKADSIFPYEILNAEQLIITENALKKIEEVFI